MMLRVTMETELSKGEIEKRIAMYEKRYGRISELMKSAREDACARPDEMDDLLIWSALAHTPTSDVEYVVRRTYRTPDVFEALTPRRVELVEELNRKDYSSLLELSSAVGRDYKNIYDDIKILEKYGMVDVRKYGRNRVPYVNVTSLYVNLAPDKKNE